MINEKIAICYSCAGESYRESAVRQLEQNYVDDDNLYYFVITDDGSTTSLERSKLRFLEEIREEKLEILLKL
jgi:hypothetical protein